MKSLRLILMFLAIATGISMFGQRRITPINNASTRTQPINETRAKNDTIDRSKLVEMRDERGNTILVDTITGREVRDTVPREQQSNIPKMIYPLFHSATVGVNLADPLMRLFGQSYGLVEFSGELNLHNRYIPVVEIGLGAAKSTPSDNNYTYRVKPTPYFRIGCNYNFLYNSNPDYQVTAGLRYGFTSFSYTIDDIHLSSNYWGDYHTFAIPRQKSNVSYLEVLFGIRVKVWGSVSMGWALRYHSILRQSKEPYGKPWYIPGYGARGSALAVSYSVFYTLPLNLKAREEVISLSDN